MIMEHIGCSRSCHDEGNGAAEGTRKVTLRFLREALMYDIRNNAYIEGHVMEEAPGHARHMVADVGEEGNEDRVLRTLSVAHAAVVEALYPYTKAWSAEDEEVDDKPEVPDEYVVEMTVPATFSKTTVRLLSGLIHEYMVCRALHDWLSMANPSASEKWMAKADEAMELAMEAKNLRTGALTRPFSPF